MSNKYILKINQVIIGNIKYMPLPKQPNAYLCWLMCMQVRSILELIRELFLATYTH